MSLQSPRFAPEDRLQMAASNAWPIRNGERSRGVHVLQNALLDLGYSMPISTRHVELNPDGHFGRETLRVVEQFQRDEGLSVDGVIGRQTMSALDRLFPAFEYRVRLHLRAVHGPGELICVVPYETAIEATQRVFGRYGIRIDYGSGESVALSESQRAAFHTIESDCVWNIPAGDMRDLQQVGTPVPANEIVVYYVRAFGDRDLLGCGGHAPGRPACTVRVDAPLWVTAHEVGHVLLTSSFDPVHMRLRQNLMHRNAVPGSGVPMLTRAQVARMKEHPCCERLTQSRPRRSIEIPRTLSFQTPMERQRWRSN